MQATQDQTPTIGQDHFRSIFTHSQDAILLLDVERDRIVEANPRAAELLGYGPEELIGLSVSAIHPDEMDRLRRFAGSVAESGSGWTDELTCATKSSARLPAEISASAVNVDGRRLVLAIVRDLTARRQVEEGRARLVRGFTHDVKNPLGAADGRLQLLRDGFMGEVSPEQTEAIENVRRSIRSALELIDDLIDVARAEAGHVDVSAGAMSVEPLVSELAEEYAGPAGARGQDLVHRATGELPMVETDGRRLRQILGNLLSNAIKYTPEGGHIEVVADCCQRPGSSPGEWVCVTVRDDGPGIPLEKQKLLFQEFSRLEPDAADGAGLGLASSHRLAMALEGDLTVHSASGQGSAFTVWIPTCLQREAAAES